MARVLIVHRDPDARKGMETILRDQHTVTTARDYLSGVKSIRTQRPAVIVAGMEHRDGDAMLLLRFLKDNGIRIPLLAVAGRGAGLYQHVAMRAGAKDFLEYPVDEARLRAGVATALAQPVNEGFVIPPLTDEEADANLTELEKRLNRDMKCFAGRNLVYLQSRIGVGTQVRPRICLKCPLRREFGLPYEMYYEHIRDVCCTDPKKCEAVQLFEARQDR